MDEERRNGLPMTDFEIAESYRLAKDKEEQINVLCDMNCCDSAKIRERLYYAGIGFSPQDIYAAAERLTSAESKCNSFGNLRNFLKSWSGITGKEARKVFKDFLYRPWGLEGHSKDFIEDMMQKVNKALNGEKDKPKGETPKIKPAFEIERAAELDALTLYRKELQRRIADNQESITKLRESIKEFEADSKTAEDTLRILDVIEKRLKTL